MDIAEIKIFLALCETRNFTKAATKCSVSISTLSRTIQRLEEEFETVFFERNNKSVEISKNGEIFKIFVQNYLDQYKSLKNDLNNAKNPLFGSISIYCSVTASYIFLPKILKKYRNVYPNVEIKIETGDAAIALQKLSEKEADFVIAAIPKKLPNFIVSRELVKIPLVFIAPINIPPHWKDNTTINWHKTPYIVSEQGELRKQQNVWFKKKHITPNIFAIVAGNEAIVTMVSLGMGIALIPEAVLENTPLRDSIQIIEKPIHLEPFNVNLCFNINRIKEETIKSFIDLLE